MSAITDSLIERYPALSGARQSIETLCQWLMETYANGNRLLVAGNGGSCADAEHIAGELLKSFKYHRPIDPVDQDILRSFGEEGIILADNLEDGLPCIALNSHIGFVTAFCNDVDPNLFYAQQLYAQARKGDLFLGISTSGNAKNIYYAMLAARVKGVRSVLLTGNKHGKCEKLAELVVSVPAGEPYLVQEYHLPIYHAMCALVEEHFYGK